MSDVLYECFDEEESVGYRVRRLSGYNAVVESRIDDSDEWETVDDDSICAHVYEQALLEKCR